MMRFRTAMLHNSIRTSFELLQNAEIQGVFRRYLTSTSSFKIRVPSSSLMPLRTFVT